MNKGDSQFLDQVGKYLKANGWKVGVLGPIKIQKAGDREFQYDLIVQLAAQKPVEKVKK